MISLDSYYTITVAAKALKEIKIKQNISTHITSVDEGFFPIRGI